MKKSLNGKASLESLKSVIEEMYSSFNEATCANIRTNLPTLLGALRAANIPQEFREGLEIAISNRLKDAIAEGTMSAEILNTLAFNRVAPPQDFLEFVYLEFISRKNGAPKNDFNMVHRAIRVLSTFSQEWLPENELRFERIKQLKERLRGNEDDTSVFIRELLSRIDPPPDKHLHIRT